MQFQQSCTLEASLQIFKDSIGSMRGSRNFCQGGGGVSRKQPGQHFYLCSKFILQFTEVLERMNVPGNNPQIHNTVV